MGGTWILSHGCSSTVWISLILHTDTKTCHVFTSTPEADTILQQHHWPGSSCQLVTATPVSFQGMQLWPGQYVVVLHVDFLFSKALWPLNDCCHVSAVILHWSELRLFYTARILNVFPGFWWKYRKILGLFLLPMRPVHKHLHQGQWFQKQRSQLCCNRVFLVYSEVPDFYKNVVWCLIKCITKMFMGIQLSWSSQTFTWSRSVFSSDSSLCSLG